MSTDRVLIEILTTADMAGIGAADAGFLGLGVSAGVATAAISALAFAGKSMIDIATEHATAEGALTAAINARLQAAAGGGQIDPYAAAKHAKDEAAAQKEIATAQVEIAASKGTHTAASAKLAEGEKKLAAAQAEVTVTQVAAAVSTAAVNTEIQNFINNNGDYISNQNDVVAGYTALIREGVPFTQLTKDMNLALEIQTQDGGTLADAVLKLQGAEAGRNVGLKTAVGLTLDSIPLNATLAEKQAIVAHNIDLVAAAYGNTLPKLTPLQTAQDHLSTTWEKMAEKDGPGLIQGMADITNAIDTSFLPSIQRAIDKNSAWAQSIDQLVAHPSWQQLYKVLFGQGTGAHIIPGGLIDKLTGPNPPSVSMGPDPMTGIPGQGGPAMDIFTNNLARRKTYAP